MAWKKNAPGCNASDGCGCGTACPIDSDDFSATNDPPAGWTEEEGTDWETTGGTLRTSTSNASLTFNTSHPDALASAIVTCYLYGADGDELRIQVNKTDDDNYHFAQLRIGDPNGCLELWERVAGVETRLSVIRVPAPAATFNQVKVYFGLDLFGAALIGGVNAAAERLSVKVTGGTGPDVGLGTGTIAGEVQFNDFAFDRHQESSGAWTVCAAYPASCYVTGDTMTRADDTDIGCGWEEVDGDWEISSNTLTTADANAICKCETEHTTGGAAAVVTTVVSGASGDKLQLILGYNPAAPTTYFYAELTIHATTGTLKIYRKTAGADTQLATVNKNYSAGTSVAFGVCLAGGRFTATVNQVGVLSPAYVSGAAVVPAATRYVALGTGSQATDVHFSSFSYFRGQDADNPECDLCTESCSCCDDTISPNSGTGRVQGATSLGGCAAGDPTYWDDVSFPMWHAFNGCQYASIDPAVDPCDGYTDTDPCGNTWYGIVAINCTTSKVTAKIRFGFFCPSSTSTIDDVDFEAAIPAGGCTDPVVMSYVGGPYLGGTNYDFSAATFTWTPD